MQSIIVAYFDDLKDPLFKLDNFFQSQAMHRINHDYHVLLKAYN